MNDIGNIGEKNAKEPIEISKRQWIFAGAIIASAGIAWFLFCTIVYKATHGLGIWIFEGLAITSFTTLIGLSFILLAPRRLAIFTYICSAALLGLLAYFTGSHESWVLLAGAGLFASLVVGEARVRRDQKLSIQFSYAKLMRRGFPIFITGVAFALALVYNTSPSGKASDTPQLAAGIGEKILIPIEYILKPMMPEFRHDMKIKEVEMLSARELPKLVKGPPEVVAMAVRELFSKLPKEEQEKNAGNFLEDFVNQQLKTTLLPYKRFFPFLYMFGLFLLLRSIGVPMMWLAIGAGWIAMKILLAANTLKIQKVMVEKEELIL